MPRLSPSGVANPARGFFFSIVELVTLSPTGRVRAAADAPRCVTLDTIRRRSLVVAGSTADDIVTRLHTMKLSAPRIEPPRRVPLQRIGAQWRHPPSCMTAAAEVVVAVTPIAGLPSCTNFDTVGRHPITAVKDRAFDLLGIEPNWSCGRHI